MADLRHCHVNVIVQLPPELSCPGVRTACTAYDRVSPDPLYEEDHQTRDRQQS